MGEYIKRLDNHEEYEIFQMQEKFGKRYISLCENEWHINYDDKKGYLKFTAEQANSQVYIYRTTTALTSNFQYSTNNGQTWNNYTFNRTTGQTITLSQVGSSVFF